MTSFEASYLYLISNDLPPPRIRMMKLAAIRTDLDPLTVNCDFYHSNPPATNGIPLLMICSNLPYMKYEPAADLKTIEKIVQGNEKALFPVKQRNVSYSVEVCSNRKAWRDDDIVPPNVNPFAAYEAARRQEMISNRRRNDGSQGLDVHHDIPAEYSQVPPSVGSSSLTVNSDYSILDSGPGFVHNSQVSQNFVLPPFESISRQYRHAPQNIFIAPSNPAPRVFLPPRTISYIPQVNLDRATDLVLPLNFHNVPLLANMPLVLVIPVVPIFVQTLVLAPPQPEYMTTPLAFNCVLRTPFPQFIYSVEPCNRPNCPFTYRYRCPAPQIESDSRQRRRPTPCRFRRGEKFNYRCSNRQDYEYTPKRSYQNTPVRRLSQSFVSPEPNETGYRPKKKRYSNHYKDRKHELDTVQEIETVTRRLENFSLNGNTIRRVSSEVKVQYASRIVLNSKNNYRFRHQVQVNETVQRGRQRSRPPFQTHKLSFEGDDFNLFKLTGLDYLAQKRRVDGEFSCLKKFYVEPKPIVDSTCRPYFLTMNRSKFYAKSIRSCLFTYLLEYLDW